MITSSLQTIKTAGYPVFLLDTQHRAVDGQFDVLYQNFYPDFKSIKSHPSRHPENHPDAQRVEASFVANFPGLEASPADRILLIFVHVPNSVCEWNGKSRYSLLQTKAAAYVVKKLVNCGVELAEIMVIGAYRAEIVELRRVLPRGVLVTSADAVQGQERPYVLFVFATTKQAGAGFTQDPRRLCVSMSRHKNFLALIGDIDTVDHENFVPANKDDVRIYLANIHKYFVVNKRVATYEDIQEAVKGGTGVPVPFTTDVRDVHDGEEDKLVAQVDGMQAQMLRLQEQINAVQNVLNARRASKSSEQATESTPECSSTPEAETSKPMTFRQRMMARTRDVSKVQQKAAADAGIAGDRSLKPGNAGTSGDRSWNTSGETGNSNTSIPTSESGLRGGP